MDIRKIRRAPPDRPFYKQPPTLLFGPICERIAPAPDEPDEAEHGGAGERYGDEPGEAEGG